MNHFISDFFTREKKPVRGLLPIEWAMFLYMGFTFLMILLTYTKLVNPQSMLIGRVQIAIITMALWGVYRLLPCRFIKVIRSFVQMGLLVWWYPDTYELNRVLPNLDHLFATWEQQLFGMQPALAFVHHFSSPIISELMDMGYASYYPLVAAVPLFYLFFYRKEFQRSAFVLTASFFLFYAIYVLLPVVGPTFYFKAIGLEQAAKGVFPPMYDYFNFHQDCLPSPGYHEGFFYHLVEDAKAAGERPTAAFPSSHVGISTICLLLIGHTKNRMLLYIMFPFYLFLCMATVYIQAHYAIDAFAGLITGVIFYYFLMYISRNMKG